MKKIPTLFARTFANHRVTGVTEDITPGCEEAFLHGQATVKIDGACCAVIGGEFYKRYDAKNGKKPPAGAIPCCDPDPVTGHWPHWVKVDENNPADRWFVEAFKAESSERLLPSGTYEAVGPHFQANPHNLRQDRLAPHGAVEVEVKRTFEGVREYLREHTIEGLVFWFNGEPVCKIKRSDFGFEWPVKRDIDTANTTKAHEGKTILRGDMIRAMGDEDLAWVLQEFRVDACGKANGAEPALPDTQKKIAEWLRQEVNTECDCPLCQAAQGEKK